MDFRFHFYLTEFNIKGFKFTFGRSCIAAHYHLIRHVFIGIHEIGIGDMNCRTNFLSQWFGEVFRLFFGFRI